MFELTQNLVVLRRNIGHRKKINLVRPLRPRRLYVRRDGKFIAPGQKQATVGRSEEEKRKEETLQFPTIADAKQLSFAYRKMDNVALVTLGGMGEHSARKEILIRHIMAVDEIPYEKAYRTFQKIEAANDKGMYLLGLPFAVGAMAMAVSGFISIPLVFDLNTVKWFNDRFVTLDAPPPKDLETWLEVGAWSWAWMEPLLGTSTFFLLCMQYFRLNMDQIGIKPYTQRLRNMRAERLAKQFPRYDREVLMNYSETATIYRS